MCKFPSARNGSQLVTDSLSSFSESNFSVHLILKRFIIAVEANNVEKKVLFCGRASALNAKEYGIFCSQTQLK